MANNLPNESPEELLQKSVRGDRKSQEKLYRQFYGFAMGVCMRYTQSRDEALEIVNDSFLKVFTGWCFANLPGFVPLQNFFCAPDYVTTFRKAPTRH